MLKYFVGLASHGSKLPLLPVLVCVLSCAGCTVDVGGATSSEFRVTATTNQYERILHYATDEQSKAQRTHVTEGEIESVKLYVTALGATNVARSMGGRVEVRHALQTSPWTAGVAPYGTFAGMALAPGSVIPLTVTPEQRRRLAQLLFDKSEAQSSYDVRISGTADRGPVDFDGRVEFVYKVKASPL